MKVSVSILLFYFINVSCSVSEQRDRFWGTKPYLFNVEIVEVGDAANLFCCEVEECETIAAEVGPVVVYL